MAKFYGPVGFVSSGEFVDGAWKSEPTERSYYGDANRISKRFEPGSKVVDDLTINNEISIVADPYAYQHFHEIRYVKWMGAVWKVNNVTVSYPRLIMTVGGVYNGPQARAARETGECSQIE